jgi:hypothetical protein
MLVTGSKKIVVNTLRAEQVLTNPSRGELQSLFNVIQPKYGVEGGIVLRGVVSRDGKNHIWGSAYHHTHNDLPLEGVPLGMSRRVFVKDGGELTDYSHSPIKVPGIGSKLERKEA